MTIKQHGGIFGRNPTFNEIGGTLTTAAQPNITSLGTQTSNLAFADGNGIDFSATAGTGTSELFDDYEEGAWTPVVEDSTGNQASALSEVGVYTKVGNLVHVAANITNIDTTGLTGASSIRIEGLPYASVNTSLIRNMGPIQATNAADTEGAYFQVDANATQGIIRFQGAAGTGNPTISDLTSGSADLFVSVTYFAA